jgi:hypothetical protein
VRTLRQLDTATGPIAYGAMCGADDYLKCPQVSPDTRYYCAYCKQYVDRLEPNGACHGCGCLACWQAIHEAKQRVEASAERAAEAIIADLPEPEQDAAVRDLVALGTKLYLRLYMADYSATDLELIKNWLNERE